MTFSQSRKTKPKQTQSNPTCSEPACPELACTELRRSVEGVEPISNRIRKKEILTGLTNHAKLWIMKQE